MEKTITIVYAMGLFSNIFGSKIDVNELMEQGAVIIDVRSPGEFQSGHVPGSKNIPLNTISQQAAKIKKMNKPIILCCASGNRSGQAARILKADGVDAHNGGGWRSVVNQLG